MDLRNLVSVSWGDHLEWGRGAARLASANDIRSCVAAWRDELDAGAILWREHRTFRDLSRFFTEPGVSSRTPSTGREPVEVEDEHAVVVEAAHAAGMQAYVYTTLFDEGWPASLGWFGGLDARQSNYVLFHPDHQLTDREGHPHHGVLCLGYDEVRRYLVGRVLWLVEQHGWDGVFLCTRSQSKPASFGDRYGFNAPIVERFRERSGVDIRQEDFDLEAWRRLQGEGLTELLRELAAELHRRDLRLTVGIPRAEYLGPPVGNLHLDWSTWIDEGIVDGLVIDQVAAVCPSTWLTMWPRDAGYGYVENHLAEGTRPPLVEDVSRRWGPAAADAGATLHLARMWHQIDVPGDRRLSELPGVTGLVYSSFRWERDRDGRVPLWPG